MIFFKTILQITDITQKCWLVWFSAGNRSSIQGSKNENSLLPFFMLLYLSEKKEELFKRKESFISELYSIEFSSFYIFFYKLCNMIIILKYTYSNFWLQPPKKGKGVFFYFLPLLGALTLPYTNPARFF